MSVQLTLRWPVPGIYHSYFAVDLFGSVWGISEHPNWPRRRARKLHPYKSNSRGNGGDYLAVHHSMARGLHKRHVSVHSLVARTFLGPRPAGAHIHHIDGDKRNNAPSNLEYVTPTENQLREHRRRRNPDD